MIEVEHLQAIEFFVKLTKPDKTLITIYSHIFSLKVNFLLNKKLLTDAIVTPSNNEISYDIPDSLRKYMDKNCMSIPSELHPTNIPYCLIDLIRSLFLSSKVQNLFSKKLVVTDTAIPTAVACRYSRLPRIPFENSIDII